MDIHLPKLDGFGATRRIMESCPTRIVMVTASSLPDEVASSFQALESGALAVLGKPPGPGHPQFPVARRGARAHGHADGRGEGGAPLAGAAAAAPRAGAAASRWTRATSAWSRSARRPAVRWCCRPSCRGCAPALPCRIVIVQHISLGFADGLGAVAGAQQRLRRAGGRARRVPAARRRLRRARRRAHEGARQRPHRCWRDDRGRRTACGRRSPACSARSRSSYGAAASACCSPAWATTARRS